MNIICRICLNSGKLISLFESNDHLQLSAKIMTFSNVKIIQGDELPSSICSNCAEKVVDLYEFKKKCEESDSKLRKNLLEINCAINVKGVEVKVGGDILTSQPQTIEVLDTDSKSNKSIKKANRKTVKKKKKVKNRKLYSSDDVDISRDDEFMNLVDDRLCDDVEVDEIKEEEASRSKFNPNETIVAAIQDHCDSTKTSNRTKKKRSNKPQREQCFTCGKVMSSRFRLKMHMRTHTGEKPYQCDYCPKKFALSQNLKVHERIHTGIKPLICTTCGRAFAQSAGLVAHMRLHTGETPYKCVLCPLGFRTPGHLQYHVSRQHTGEKRHICSVCTRAFITRGDLTQHSRTHSGERPHVCSVCGLRLGRASHLARHMLTHTGAKPHACQMCSATYAQRGDLARHIKRHSHYGPESDVQNAPQKTVPTSEPISVQH